MSVAMCHHESSGTGAVAMGGSANSLGAKCLQGGTTHGGGGGTLGVQDAVVEKQQRQNKSVVFVFGRGGDVSTDRTMEHSFEGEKILPIGQHGRHEKTFRGG